MPCLLLQNRVFLPTFARMDTKELILAMLDACIDEVEGTFRGYYEYWNTHIQDRENKKIAILEVLAQEAESRQSILRQTCLVDIIRWGVSVDKRIYTEICFKIIRQELADLPTQASQISEKNESSMHLINEIMHTFYYEGKLTYNTDKERNKFIELAYRLGNFEYVRDEDDEKGWTFAPYNWLDCAVQKTIGILAWFARSYKSEKALTCLKNIFCNKYNNASWVKDEAIAKYIDVWRELNITYKIHYNHEEIDAPTIDWKELYELTETAIKQEYADFALYGSDNMWLRMLKSGENIVLFYQDENDIVYHSQNIDALDDETLIPFILRDDRVIHLPTAFKIYCLEMGLLEFLFHDLIRKGEVRARKKDKKHLSLNTMYFGLEKCDKDYLG